MKAMLISVLCAFSLTTAEAVRADVLDLPVSEIRTIPGVEVDQIHLKFNTQAIRGEGNVHVVAAYLDWVLPESAPDEEYECTVYEATQSGLANDAETSDLAPVAQCSVSRADRRSSDGLVRLHLTELLKKWCEFPDDNVGVVLEISGLPASSILETLAVAQLTVLFAKARDSVASH